MTARRALVRSVGPTVLAALSLAALSCGSEDEPPLPPRPAVVDVSLSDEYRFDYTPPRAPGRTVFKVRNDGGQEHELVLLPLPEDFPPLEQQVRGRKRRAVGTLAYQQPLGAGGRGLFAVDLERGRYGLVCFVEGRDRIPHSRKGMVAEFRIG